MKIQKIRIEGFRSLRLPQRILLKDGRSMCLLADNGHGKSSVVDAMEFWSTGDVGWVHRDGVGLGALVHLGADKATVEIETDSVTATRELAGSRPGDLQVDQGVILASPAPEAIPMLRHRTMAGFVDLSANDKRAELLAMLGLSELVPFRLGIRSAARRARSDAEEAAATARTAQLALEQALEGQQLEARIVDLAREAGVAVADAEQLMAFGEDRLRGAPPAGTTLAQVDELQAANTALADKSVAAWNAALADQEVAAERGLSALLAAGQQLLGTWPEDRCPLCLVEQSRDDLARRVAERARELAAADQLFAAAAAQAEERRQAIERLGRALRAVVDDERNAKWVDLANARAALDALRDELRDTKEAESRRAPLPAVPTVLPGEALERLRVDALRSPADAATALVALATLRTRVIAQRRASATQSGAERVAVAAEAAAGLADAAVRGAIDGALKSLNATVADIYARLIGSSPYGDVKLVYREARAGGVEFSFVWNETEEISPPQRIMSESQLGALGLALFLARLKVRPPQWRTLVLDDVVTSFDVVHRARLVRLLGEEFGDWQVILCTHDPQLSRVIVDELQGWLPVKLTSWTAADGPVFGEAKPAQRLRQLLQEGRAADELGGLARQAMEQALERPVRRLGLRIRHDPANRYSADEYRQSLLEGLRSGNFVHADHPVLRRLATGGSITNRACHFKEHEPGVTRADLDLLLEDLEELERLFRCDGCGKSAWEIRDVASGRCQCHCGQLSCA